MRYYFCFLILVLSSVAATAQPGRNGGYQYTPFSIKVLTAGETDSLFYRSASAVFGDNQVPIDRFAKVYPRIKPVLVAGSRNGIIRRFREAEAALPGKKLPVKDTDAFEKLKGQYADAIRAETERTLRETPSLSGYLWYTQNDRITYYHSIVRVKPDGKLLVTENIRIFNGDGRPNPLYNYDMPAATEGVVNNEIVRGIVRRFPLFYINRFRLFQNTTFKLLEVYKDGRVEDFFTKKEVNGISVYIGKKYFSLLKGYYTYSITYETDHQLKLLKDYDELSWNVTGTQWSFRIDSARCTIILPASAGYLSARCYTGFQGSTATDCNYTREISGDSSVISFVTSRPLQPMQGITVAVSWNKGYVKGPGAWQRIGYYIWNNKAVFFLPLAALFSALFCFFFWWRYGRDPKKGTVYPLFEPPAGYSPAALGYIYDQKFSRRLTAATMVDAAVRNIIQIDVEREGGLFKHNAYHISNSKKADKPAVSGYEDFKSDIQDLAGSTIKKGKYNSDLADLNNEVEKYCKDHYLNKDGGFRKGYRGMFTLNSRYTILPILVCVAAGIWGLLALIKALMLRNFWQAAYFVLGWILCVQVLKLFSRLLAAYSPDGRKLMDKIEGFRMFLATADEQRFDLMNPPEKTLELYEKYLPFAIALGCEIQWGEKFEAIINAAYQDPNAANVSSFSQSISHDSQSFSSSFTSSFSGAISSASTPPSSSSGGGSSFGGGSSGGGGGGGGGGGW